MVAKTQFPFAPRGSGTVRAIVTVAFLASTNLCSADVATQADLSMLSDFGVNDIADRGGRFGNFAAILQSAGSSSNVAYIEQTVISNSAQIWQYGAKSVASIHQDGEMNVARLWQEGESHTAALSQVGSDNHIAAVQYESGSMLSGSQVGSGNVAAVVMMGGSQLTFLQQGDNNSLFATLPSKVIVDVSQIGSGMSATLSGK